MILSEQQIDFLRSKYLNICDKCNCFKPPRAHHCSKCGRCVLRMDHHCRWVANCIGHRNLKHYLLLVFYITIVCFATIATFISKGVKCSKVKCELNPKLKIEYLVLSVSASVLDVLVGFFCMILFVYQLKLIYDNRSYIDSR